jgi:glyceraldehyde-3-phosphate dehydrogenase (NAD(P))
MKVCVNGYGTIGKRVADAVQKHPNMELVGISKYTPGNDAKMANSLGIKVFVPVDAKENFKGVEVAGTVEEMINAADIIIDASADGLGESNKKIYEHAGKPAIFQGGEEDTIGKSFNARSNYDDVKEEKYLRVVSCNTTSFSRVLKPLSEKFTIKKADAFLIRRGSDPFDKKGSSLNSVEWEANSHHAHDVNTIMNVPMTSFAFKVPHTLSHVNSLQLEFEQEVTKEEIIETLQNENRVIVAEAKSTSQIIETARDLGLKRYDLYMPVVIKNSITVSGNRVFLTMMVPQESVVVPEVLDAINAISDVSKEESMRKTEQVLEMEKIKSSMEKIHG